MNKKYIVQNCRITFTLHIGTNKTQSVGKAKDVPN
jgi:hypothetical protein